MAAVISRCNNRCAKETWRSDFKSLRIIAAAGGLNESSQVVEVCDAGQAVLTGIVPPELCHRSISNGKFGPRPGRGRASVVGKITAVSRRQHLHHFSNH